MSLPPEEEREPCEYHTLLREHLENESRERARFEALVSGLRASCGHEKLTCWLRGYRGEARLCRRCMAVVQKSKDFQSS